MSSDDLPQFLDRCSLLGHLALQLLAVPGPQARLLALAILAYLAVLHTPPVTSANVDRVDQKKQNSPPARRSSSIALDFPRLACRLRKHGSSKKTARVQPRTRLTGHADRPVGAGSPPFLTVAVLCVLVATFIAPDFGSVAQSASR